MDSKLMLYLRFSELLESAPNLDSVKAETRAKFPDILLSIPPAKLKSGLASYVRQLSTKLMAQENYKEVLNELTEELWVCIPSSISVDEFHFLLLSNATQLLIVVETRKKMMQCLQNLVTSDVDSSARMVLL